MCVQIALRASLIAKLWHVTQETRRPVEHVRLVKEAMTTLAMGRAMIRSMRIANLSPIQSLQLLLTVLASQQGI